MVAGDWQPHVPAATVGRPDTAGAVVGRPYVVRPLLNARETVKSQVTAVYRKLAVSSRAAAVAEAKRLGMLSS